MVRRIQATQLTAKPLGKPSACVTKSAQASVTESLRRPAIISCCPGTKYVTTHARLLPQQERS